MAVTADPVDVFREKIPDLSEALADSHNFDRFTDYLFSENLITEALLSDITTTSSYSAYRRGSAISRELHRQLQSSSDPKSLLVRICNVLVKQQDKELQQLGRDMKTVFGSLNALTEQLGKQKDVSSHKEELVKTTPTGYLDIRDLDIVSERLASVVFPNSKWKLLGLSLGLYKPTLDDIDDTCRGKPIHCLTECLGAWLDGKDNVIGKGGPSWTTLKSSLEKIGEKGCANKIDHNPVP